MPVLKVTVGCIGSKERQAPTLGLLFTEVSVKRQSTRLYTKNNHTLSRCNHCSVPEMFLLWVAKKTGYQQ